MKILVVSMYGKIFIQSILASLIFIICISCKDEQIFNSEFEPSIPTIPDLPQYDLTFNSVVKTSYNMPTVTTFAKINDTFYLVGGLGPILTYNEINKSWEYKSFNSSENLYRRKGVLFQHGDSLLWFATPYIDADRREGYFFISINPITWAINLTNIPLPILEPENFISHISYENKAIIFLTVSQRIHILDMNDLLGNFIDSFPIDAAPYGSPEIHVGSYKNYVYGYYPYDKKFFKMNLDTFGYENIPIPEYITKRIETYSLVRSGVVEDLFCFWIYGFNFTFCYDLEKNTWGIVESNYYKNLHPFEWIYSNTDSCLYNLDLVNKEIVKITRE